MKVTKPKENQLLFEDDVLKGFELEVKSKTGLANSPINDLYETFMLFYRFKGMDASKQLYTGNKISIMTGINSMLEQLIRAEIITKKDLKEIISNLYEIGVL